jgi:hypothetical protein
MERGEFARSSFRREGEGKKTTEGGNLRRRRGVVAFAAVFAGLRRPRLPPPAKRLRCLPSRWLRLGLLFSARQSRAVSVASPRHRHHCRPLEAEDLSG